MTVQAATKAVQESLDAVKSHCMCFCFEETTTHYRVLYPDGYFPNGVQASKRLGKAEALSRILGAMERHWKESFPGAA